jgi:HSP20 family molecular chaperone IbpA
MVRDELFAELIYRPWAISGAGARRVPLDLHETADGYLVEIDLAGVAPEQLRVFVGAQPDRHRPAPGRDPGGLVAAL